MKNKEIYGYVKTSDGTEFKIVEKKVDFQRQVTKLKAKLSAQDINIEPVLCLEQGGQLYKPDDILGYSFVFTDDDADKGSINFIKMLEFPAKIASVMSKSVFNKTMISYIIDNPQYLSSGIISELAMHQNIFFADNFIESLEDKYFFKAFLENPYRTVEYMNHYKNFILDRIKKVIKNNIDGDISFGLDFFDLESEFRVSLTKMNEMYYEGKFDLESLKFFINDYIEDIQIESLTKIDDLQYILNAVNNACSYVNKSQIISDLETEISIIKSKNEKYNIFIIK